MRGATAQMGRRITIRGQDIADRSVRNRQGEDLGSIKDVVIDINDGCIAYAALAFGGFLGLGEDLYAIPWEALEYNASDDSFVLEVSKERLENAPSFDKDNWPTTADREWLSGMYTHFGHTPYWERRIER